MAVIVTDKAKWTEDRDGFWISFRTSDRGEATAIAETVNTPHEVTVKQKRKARSLDANGYLWVLLDKLAAKLSTKEAPVTKVDVYRRLIPDVGGVSDIVCTKIGAADKLREGWEHNGLGWVTETIPSKIEGCVNVILYYGSSTYDTAQMSRLIDLIVQDCKAQGIETLTPDKLDAMKVKWGEAYGDR